MSAPALRSSVRELRVRAGWSQTTLGERVGLTRQSLAAIESGGAVPSTEVALRLARAFGVTVESLFQLEDQPSPSCVVEAAEARVPPSGRVRIATVAGQRRAYGVTLADAAGSPAADGVVAERLSDGRLRVRPLSEGPPPPDLVVAGCDPAFGLVRALLQREHGIEVLWLRMGSEAALDALARGVAHVAGVHLEDAASGTYNAPWIERMVPFPATRIAFATWQQAVLLERGNPLGVAGLDDLARPDLRFLNREPGSGSRALMERALAEHGIDASAIPGFLETRADGHETVARTIASGAAQAGVAIRAVGHALDLAMLPLAEEPYDLVVPDHFLELPAIEALLAALRRPALREQVEALTGYDAAHMGKPM
jgi:molybdate-binding protein/DNA-binding XRE family transcriptional regulator